jgi:Phosphotransferase enzyme family
LSLLPEGAEGLPEARRNALLRRLDWRFLLANPETPAADELVELGFPSARGLEGARRRLRPGGEVVCAWRVPRPGGASRARRRLAAAGFLDAEVYWPGPLPWRLPQFWLPLGSAAAERVLLRSRPPRSALQRLVRVLWRCAARAGLLAPAIAIGRLPAGEEATTTAPPGAWLLLTGGHRAINKAVGLRVGEGGEVLNVAKHARVPEAELGLANEGRLLEIVAERRPGLGGVPRLLSRSRRGGLLSILETPIGGDRLLESLGEDSFRRSALTVTEWLVQLAGAGEPRPAAEWRERLVEEPLRRFEQSFGPALPELGARMRGALASLPELPLVVEHRDCSPWNVILSRRGDPALLDWESAEPEGLPLMDLVYFLANCAFVLDRALENGTTRRSYANLLDPTSARGAVAAECFAAYAAGVGLDPGCAGPLRLLCWLVHTRSEFDHLDADGGGRAPSAAELRRGVFAGLLDEELR